MTGSASTGGSVDFTTAFASQTPSGSVSISSVTGSAGATTLGTPAIPAHKHQLAGYSGSTPTVPGTGPALAQPGGSPNEVSIYDGQPPGQRRDLSPAMVDTGGGGSHTHPFSFSSGSGTFSGNAINLAVKYVDVIRATKN